MNIERQEASESEPAAARIVRALAGRIIEGKIPAGEKLRQDHIAEEFGMSHVPVREAFRRLEEQGLVVSQPRRGVRVADFTKQDVREVAEMRSALESLALRYAAPNITPAILDEAEAINLMGDQAADVWSWEEANRRFHRLLLAPCEMPRLLRTIDDLHVASARFLFASWKAEWETPTDRDHRAILAALRTGNPEQACSILARHVQWTGAATQR